METLYLRTTTQVEPLVNNWYAWPLLIAPAPAALLTSFHLRLMESFVQAPQLHQDAAKNPAMRGGPFMDYRGDIGAVNSFIEFIKRELSSTLELASSIKAFDLKLREEAKGQALQDHYALIPVQLRGYVELGYDLGHRSSLRFLEPLLYRSRHYRPDLQTLTFRENARDSRPFVLSTPRLNPRTELRLRLPFAAEPLTTLLAARDQPVSRDFVEQILQTHLDPASSQEDFRRLFTPVPQERSPERNYSGAGVRVRYFGHATVLIETQQVSILTDPIVSYGDSIGPRRFTYKDLPDSIDVVLLTHAHQDHVMFETLLQLRHKVRTWVVPKNSGGTLQDPSLKLMLKILGFRNVIELDEMESIDYADCRITGVPFFGEHADLHIRSKLAYHVRAGRSSLLFLADSRNLDHTLYQHVHAELGDVDTVFIGMECDGAPMSWLYGPLFSTAIDRRIDQSRRLSGSDFEQAWRIVSCFNPRAAYVYAMAGEPWLKFISSVEYTGQSRPILESDKLLAECARRGIQAERLYCQKVLFLD